METEKRWAVETKYNYLDRWHRTTRLFDSREEAERWSESYIAGYVFHEIEMRIVPVEIRYLNEDEI